MNFINRIYSKIPRFLDYELHGLATYNALTYKLQILIRNLKLELVTCSL